ncbi:helix-turn-helix transcriptional regulator [Streptomonospora nanhaiensis]|uniref:Helix-turn-helix transcriptional regulator n=1 Tax=Streptomonospora nanhaiensis TaxID=1323731 RepID=A0ABY6YP57_9ACTN|nr:helix-turn-helix transcriptional regulator [Streptomonospora nanhaiensis]WAE73595.1 helix-turn-helix transcriptional regulator [Streptomonospora nanhaiensis]
MDRRAHSPTVRLRRLARLLHRARVDAEYGVTEAAKHLGWSGTKVGRLEAAETRRIQPADIDALADLYRVDATSRAEWTALAAQAKERGWWAKYQKSGVFTDDLPGFEAEASVIRTFEPQVIPGLLQTPGYAEMILRGGQAQDDAAVAARVDARIERQGILHRHDPPDYWAVIDEAAVRRGAEAAPEIMADQIRHLLRMATRAGVTIQVLPFSAGAHAASTGAIVVMDYAEPLDPSIVYVEHYAASLMLEEPDEISLVTNVFAHVSAAALSGADSAGFLRTVLASLETETDE